MNTLSNEEYDALIKGARILERDTHGAKVLALVNGDYLKLFRRKRFFSSAAWYPYAQRFADNAVGLAERQIPCPVVREVYTIPTQKRQAVRYAPLPGTPLRGLVATAVAGKSLPSQLGEFVAGLHKAGVYFRSLHLGNVILTPRNELGLIDIADMSIYRHAISSRQMKSNLKRLRRDPLDAAWLRGENDVLFQASYADTLFRNTHADR